MSDTQKSVDIFDLIYILLRNIKIIFMITIPSMIIVVIISMISLRMPPEKSFMPNTYSPKSLVLLNNNGGGLDSLMGNSSMGALAGLAGLSGGETGPTDIDLAIKLASTNSFINKLDEAFDLKKIYNTEEAEFPKTALRKAIRGRLEISMDDTPGIMIISYTSIDKFLATNIVNLVTDLLEEEFTKIDMVRNKNQFALVEKNKLKIENDIKKISEDTIAFQNKYNLIDVDVVFSELLRQTSSLQSDLLKKNIEIENYSMVSNIKDPGYKRLVNEKLAIQNAISKLENGEVGNFPPVKDLPKLGHELQQLRAEMEIKQAVYKTIIQQYEALKLTTTGKGSTFQVLEKAYIPEIKSGPSRGKLCIIVTFVSFFFSLFVIYMKEFIKDVKSDPEKMRKIRGKVK